MTQQAISERVRTSALRRSPAVREALRAFALSRTLVWGAALLAVYVIPFDRYQQRLHDVPMFTGGLGRALGSLARWDATWYLSLAHSGYQTASPTGAAFFALYPVSVRAAAFGIPSGWALLLASYAVSAAALFVALVLLHRLVELELGRRFAPAALMLVALWPASFFFSAPYSESLFLALSIGMFYAARTDRWGWAAGLCAAATATRATGMLLLLPLAIMAWRARKLQWLAIAPLGAVAFSLWLTIAGLRPFGWADVERDWGHVYKGPFGGVHDAIVAGWNGVGQVFGSGGADRVVAAENTIYLVFLVVALIATVGVFRRLRPEYGAYVAISLLVAVSAPVAWQPLMAFGRLLAVVFPIPMWLAVVLYRRRAATAAVYAASAVLLACATGAFATWHLVT
jgi:Mannosyltransferase (PIG-V)